MKFTLWMALLAVAMSQTVATAKTVHVSLSGSSTPPYGSWATAATNIQAGIDEAGEDGIVFVDSGTYVLSEQLMITNGITLKGAKGSKETTIDGADSVRCICVVHSNALIDGFTIVHGYTDYLRPGPAKYDGGGMYIDMGTVRDCEFRDNYAEDIGGGIFAVWATIDKCRFVSNLASNGGGLGGSNSVLRNCLLARNLAGDLGGGLTLAGNSSLAVNCTIAFNVANYDGGGVWIYADRPVLENCIVYSNSAPADANYGGYSDGSWGYSCTYPYTNGAGNIDTDPSFADPSADDFRLTADSPCIDAGTNAAWMSTNADVRGETRVFNQQVDMGACEATITGVAGATTGDVETVWDAVPMARCQLQRCSDIALTNWVNVGGVVTASVSCITLPDTNSLGGAPAYYRLLWLK